MSDETWTRTQLFDGLEPSPGFVTQLERLGLLRVVGRDESGEKIYASEARDQLGKVLSLVELGYQPKDIAIIAKRVGLPDRRSRRFFRRPPTYVHLDELARRAGVEVAVAQGWLRDGYVEAVLVAEGGDPLFDASAIERARSLADLRAFGLGDAELRQWSSLGPALSALLKAAPDKAAKERAEGPVVAVVEAHTEALDAVVARLERWRRGLRRWDRIVAQCYKKLERLRRAYGLEAETRRRARKRLRLTSRRGRSGKRR